MAQQLYATTERSNQNLVKAIVLTGLLAGTLDITSAMLVSQVYPLPIGRFIATGIFGREALSGGVGMGIFGLFLHYVIAFIWTIIFFVAYPRLSILSRNKVIVGLAYGIVVWIGMNLIVVPMSNVTRRPMQVKGVLINASILMVMIGLPISIMAHRYYADKRTSQPAA
jgi:hypothetical protein